jgi:hypothetical protein
VCLVAIAISTRVQVAVGLDPKSGQQAGGPPKRAPPGRWQQQNNGPVQQQNAQYQRGRRMQGYGKDTREAPGDFNSRQRQMQQQQQQQQQQEQGAYDGTVEEGQGGDVKPTFPGDRVPMYTKKVHHRAAVAFVAFTSATLLSLLVEKAVFSKTSIFAALVFATGCFFSCYTTGDFGQFSTALGVGTILFIKTLQPRIFISSAFRQLLAASMLSTRKPFPPVENPWTCKDVLDSSSGVPFSMINSILSMVFVAMFVGYAFFDRVPFFPAWIGGLATSLVTGYTTTTRNGKGDFLRFFGHSTNVLFSEVLACVDDVYLREKTRIMFNRTFSFVHRLDQRYHLLGKIQALFNRLLDILKGLKSDMDATKA